MNSADKYEELIRRGLIVPQPETPMYFKFPSLLVSVPSVTTGGIIDPEVKRVIDAKLERNPNRNQR